MPYNEKKVNILQVSDLHYSSEHKKDIIEIIDALIIDVNKVVEDNLLGEVNYLCFTGDCIQVGDKAHDEFISFQENILNKLKSEIKGNIQLLIVPGNHEVARNKIDKYQEDGIEKNLTNKDAIEMFMIDPPSGAFSRIEHVKALVKGINEDVVYDNDLSYHFIDNDSKIGFIGLNSAWRSSGKGESEYSKMIVGEKQITDAYRSIEDMDIKICMMHHPTEWLLPSDRKCIENILSKFDLVLNGHVHDEDDYQKMSHQRKTIYLTAGKLYPIQNQFNTYNLISIMPDSKKCTIYYREYYSGKRNEFDQSTRVCKNGYDKYDFLNDEIETLAYRIITDIGTELEDEFNSLLIYNTINQEKNGILRSCYVTPTFTKHSDYVKEKDYDLDEENEDVELKTILASNDNVVFIGKKEIGKTCLLYKCAIEFLNNYKQYGFIPVIISTENIRKGNILKAISLFFNSYINDTKGITKDEVNKLLMHGKIVFLIDNLDMRNKNMLKCIREFAVQNKKCKYFFSVNENLISSLNLKDLVDIGLEFQNYYIQTMNSTQIRQLTNSWFYGIDSTEILTKVQGYFLSIALPKTAFNLSLILSICEYNPSFTNINESNVMTRFMEILLEKLSQEEFYSSKYDFEDKEKFLSALAKKMAFNERNYFEKLEFDEFTSDYHKSKGYTLVDSKFDKIFFEKGILVIDDNYVYFKYQSMLEYYIAKAAIFDNTFLEILLSEKNYLKYACSICYYTGMNREAINVLEKIETYMDKYSESHFENFDILNDYHIKIDISTEEDVEERIDNIRLSEEKKDEIQDLKYTRGDYDYNPLIVKKESDIEEGDDYSETLQLFGHILRNLNDISAEEKKKYLNKYMKSHLVLLVIIKDILEEMLKEYSEKINKPKKDDINDDESEENDKIELNKIIDIVSDIFKISLPLCFQNIIAENVATAKLSNTILTLMQSEEIEFIKFMYVFLYADIGAKDSLDMAINYTQNTSSKDLEKISLFKMIYYYSIDFFPQRRYDLKRFISESLSKNHKSKRRGNVQANNYARSIIEKNLDFIV